jgi:hypothetical protein
LTPEWQSAIGADWERVHATKLHTLGNLTLTGYNSEYGYKSFAEKRGMEGGFKSSPLHLNVGLGDLEGWNESEIDARASRLATLAAKVWIVPELKAEVLSGTSPRRPARDPNTRLTTTATWVSRHHREPCSNC